MVDLRLVWSSLPQTPDSKASIVSAKKMAAALSRELIHTQMKP